MNSKRGLISQRQPRMVNYDSKLLITDKFHVAQGVDPEYDATLQTVQAIETKLELYLQEQSKLLKYSIYINCIILDVRCLIKIWVKNCISLKSL